jgi:hypothetical protein
MTRTGLTPAQQAEVDRWVIDPLYWAKKFGPTDFDPWSGQVALWDAYGRILNAKLKRYEGLVLTDEETALADKMGISVMSGHGLGKERTVATMGLHYLFCLKAYQPKGVCTAPAGPTLQSTLWPEFGKVLAGSETLTALFDKQSNRIFLKEDPKRGEFMRIEPRTIQQNSNPDEQGAVLAGIHATGVIYLITEASEVREPVFKPIEGGLTDPLSLVIMIFNPTRRDGFAALSHTTYRKNWLCLQWSARTIKQEKLAAPGRYPWFNERAQDVLIEKYGDDSDTVRIRVDGLPPKQSSNTLIHYDAALAALARPVELTDADPLCLFLDVGGEGDDPSMLTVLRGPVLLEQVAFNQKDTTELSDAVAGKLSDTLASLPLDAQYAVGVDVIGLGRGVYDQLANVQRVRHLYRLDVSEKALDELRYHRLRDQALWELREGFMETKEIAVVLDQFTMSEQEELVAELTTIKWAEVNGKIKVQGKGASSGIPSVPPLAKSPNRLDSLYGAWWLYRHCVSRLPAGHRLTRRVRWRRRERPISWKAL